MGYFAVSYQLNKQKDYQNLWDELERLNAHKVMRSFYFLDVNLEECSPLRDHLKEFIDKDDMLAVVKIESKPECFRPFEGTGDWVDARF